MSDPKNIVFRNIGPGTYRVTFDGKEYVEAAPVLARIKELEAEIANSNKFAQDQENKITELEKENAQYKKHLELFEESIRHSFKVREDHLKAQLSACKKQRNLFVNVHFQYKPNTVWNPTNKIEELDKALEEIK